MSIPKIGLVGGLGPLSTVDYYLGLVNRYHKDFGMDDYPEIVIDSLNLKDCLRYMEEEDITGLKKMIRQSQDSLKRAGASFGAICSNTPHLFQKELFEGSPLEMVSIVDATLQFIHSKGYKKVLILGTPLTMSKGLYDKRMPLYGIEPIVPEEKDRDSIGDIIFPNLENGIIIPEDKKRLLEKINQYVNTQKAEAVLLGCTELPLLIKPEDVPVPVINTTEIHIDAIYKKYVSLLEEKMPSNNCLQA